MKSEPPLFRKFDCLLEKMRLALIIAALSVAVAQMAHAEPLRLQDQDFLEDNSGRTVVASIYYADLTDKLATLRDAYPHIRLDDIHSFIVRAPAEALLRASKLPSVREIEIIDEDESDRISRLLLAIDRTDRLDKNAYNFGALNISLGVPAAKYGTFRTADDTVRRAIEHLIAHRDIPVVMSIGNNGPSPGLVNPWALASGVFIATATDVTGKQLWSGSSRFHEGGANGHHLFAAHGYLSIGAWAAGTPKTKKMLEAEKKVDLTKLVGAGNEHLYRVDSGTSYAAANLTRALCLAHQSTELLRLQMNATKPLKGTLPRFIRAYADTGIDANHPMFAHRLAGTRHVYGGLNVEFGATRRKALLTLIERGVEINLRYGVHTALEILKRSAQPVPNTTVDETGYGFVSNATVAKALKSLTFPDLIAIYGDPTDPRAGGWMKAAAHIKGPVFLPAEVEQIEQYCNDYDLVFMSKVQ